MSSQTASAAPPGSALVPGAPLDSGRGVGRTQPQVVRPARLIREGRGEPPDPAAAQTAWGHGDNLCCEHLALLIVCGDRYSRSGMLTQPAGQRPSGDPHGILRHRTPHRPDMLSEMWVHGQLCRSQVGPENRTGDTSEGHERQDRSQREGPPPWVSPTISYGRATRETMNRRALQPCSSRLQWTSRHCWHRDAGSGYHFQPASCETWVSQNKP